MDANLSRNGISRDLVFTEPVVEDLHGSIKVSLNQSFLKQAFLKATRGKNRQYYSFTNYAEHIIEERTVNHITSKCNKSPIFIKVAIPELDLMSRSDFLEAEVTWEFNPEVPMPDLQGLKVKRLKAVVPEEYRNDRKRYILERYQSYSSVEGPIQVGDYLRTQWYIEEESTEDQWILIGVRPRLMPDLEEKFLQAEVGGTVQYTMEIPRNFKESQLPPKYIRLIAGLVGKTIEMKIQIMEAKRPVLPEPEQLVERGVFKSVEDFEKAIDSLVEVEVAELRRRYGITQIIDGLNTMEFPIPSSITAQVRDTLSKELKFDSVESFNQVLGADFSPERFESELQSAAERIARGEYLIQKLPELIGLTGKQMEDQLLDKLLRLDLKGKSQKEIRNIFRYYRNQWSNEIILENTLNYLETSELVSDEEVEWEQAQKLAQPDPMNLRYFTGLGPLERSKENVEVDTVPDPVT
jgi:FKBP-type peptidyl-prolyl cis-trans isomerase (trigger factor)